MGAAAEQSDDVEDGLQRRVDDLVAAHGGDPRAVIETLLLVNDARAAATSYGYVRGRAVGAALLDHGR
ncbi:hypothetical protein SAMN02745157_1628 [Kaistia soli DSM 19436]|uniref:Uncharacterized protein n=1 Tax=Kaistia soli DSM 19436 TaxID=1122133 RepID=A0A1M4YUX7_9HYPH|nr:hypothetical protein [Kaistia soli]SHF09609.1 hypothetical protein SAMN02745157_1628 [Kaistia soli DSM 19436]